jgi:hypothetical protein
MRFITVDDQSKIPVLLWQEQPGKAPKVISRHRSLDEVPDAAHLDIFQFDVPLTTRIKTPLNPGNHSFVDAQGAPLWEGARIAFRVQSHYVNTVSGRGALKKVDQYGGVMFVADNPMDVYDQRGFIVGNRRDQYAAMGNYQYDGVCKGMRVVAGKLGDPYEHGVTKTFIVLDQDPREVCVPVPHPGAAPSR